MLNGVIRFTHPQDCADRKFVRQMTVKPFGSPETVRPVEVDAEELGVSI